MEGHGPLGLPMLFWLLREGLAAAWDNADAVVWKESVSTLPRGMSDEADSAGNTDMVCRFCWSMNLGLDRILHPEAVCSIAMSASSHSPAKKNEEAKTLGGFCFGGRLEATLTFEKQSTLARQNV